LADFLIWSGFIASLRDKEKEQQHPFRWTLIESDQRKRELAFEQVLMKRMPPGGGKLLYKNKLLWLVPGAERSTQAIQQKTNGLRIDSLKVLLFNSSIFSWLVGLWKDVF